MAIPILELDADLGRREVIQMKSDRVSVLKSKDEDLFSSEPDNEMLRSWIADAKNSIRSVEDQSTQLSVGRATTGNWTKRKHAQRPVKFDQRCLNCSEDQQQLAKLFKIACLAYHPNTVTYRRQDFAREQLFTMRKYLVGQAA